MLCVSLPVRAGREYRGMKSKRVAPPPQFNSPDSDQFGFGDPSPNPLLSQCPQHPPSTHILSASFFKFTKTTPPLDSKLEQEPSPSESLFALGCTLECGGWGWGRGASPSRPTPRRPQNWFPPAPRAPRAPVPRPARGGQRHRARSPGASAAAAAAAAPRGLRGQPGLRRLLSSRSLRRRLPWPGSVPGTRRGGGGREGGGRARSARGPGLRAAEGASRGQHQAAKRASRRWPGGVPAQPAGKPGFPTAALPAPPPLLPEKVGKSPTRARTASSRLRSRWPTTTQRDVGDHLAGIFLASVSPMTPGKAGCQRSRPRGHAPPLLGGLCPGEPVPPPLSSRPAPTVPEVGGRARDDGGRTPARLALAPAPAPAPGAGFPRPVPAGEPPEPRCS